MSASQHPQHQTSFYIWIWALLLAMMGLSLAVGYLGHSNLAAVSIYSIAIMKAILVARYYMGLAWEPRYITLGLLLALLMIVLLFVALIPDIVGTYGRT